MIHLCPSMGKPALVYHMRERCTQLIPPLACYISWSQELHRSESVQEKNVKEARTKCRTIASLLTDAPNPHSKGVLMFKKRRQRAKKYTLISYGSVDEDRYNEEEDGIFPTTSESEFDEEGFSDARSLTNHSFSDWDSAYLDIEKPHSQPDSQQGLSATSGKGAALFEQQRQRTEQNIVEQVPAQKTDSMTEVKAEFQEETPPRKSMVIGEGSPPKTSLSSPILASTESVRSLNSVRADSVPTQLLPSETQLESISLQTATFNRTARPFTPGFVGKRATTAPVAFRPSVPKAHSEVQGTQSRVAAPFSPTSPDAPMTVLNSGRQPGIKEHKQPGRHATPASTTASLYIPPPERQHAASIPQPVKGDRVSEPKSFLAAFQPPVPTAATSSTSLYISLPSRIGVPSPPPPAMVAKSPEPSPVASAVLPLATTASSSGSLYMSSPPNENVVSASSPKSSQLTTSTLISPISAVTSSLSHVRSPSEALTSREQRIAVPASRTGILQDARRRGAKKQMFSPIEQKKKNSPNPELLSMVQNLDEKPKQDHLGAGFESGPEEDFLSLGAEACNFMQSQARKSKTPPPVAPKPQLRTTLVGFVNGSPATDQPQMRGKGAELFAKRQSRMDKFVVEGTPVQTSVPRSPSPTPSLPASWKYSPNIRAPPPIAYNPLHSPFHPLGAARSSPSTVDSKFKKKTSPKTGIKAIDFMRHQPYQLNSAMFCFNGSSSPSTQMLHKDGTMPSSSPKQPGQFVSPAKQVPLKTARVHEIKRFSTPMPLSGSSTLTPTVITPRSATTLAEPVWRSEITSPPPPLTLPSNAPRVPVQDIRQCKSAPNLSLVDARDRSSLHSVPEDAAGHVSVPTMISAQVQKPRFSVSRLGIQANVWRPASVHQ